jgi:hypothetical protein
MTNCESYKRSELHLAAQDANSGQHARTEQHERAGLRGRAVVDVVHKPVPGTAFTRIIPQALAL